MKRRLRDPLPDDGYQVVRDNFVWPDHVLRLLVTAGAVAWLAPESVCDPACGDASIVEHAYRLRPFKKSFLNDLSVPQIAQLWGRHGFPAQLTSGDALKAVEGLQHPVSVTVLTEILEHIEEPERLLEAVRAKSRYLVASSPLDEQPGVGNHEHVWAWDREGYGAMLVASGFQAMAYTEIAFPSSGYPYTYQLWVCR